MRTVAQSVQRNALTYILAAELVVPAKKTIKSMHYRVRSLYYSEMKKLFGDLPASVSIAIFALTVYRGTGTLAFVRSVDAILDTVADDLLMNATAV